jgi:hypothetical protein
LASSSRQKTIEERPIALERKPEVFGRHVVSSIPIAVQAPVAPSQNHRPPLHQFGDQRIWLFDRAPWLIHKPTLDLTPMLAEVSSILFGKQRGVRA